MLTRGGHMVTTHCVHGGQWPVPGPDSTIEAQRQQQADEDNSAEYDDCQQHAGHGVTALAVHLPLLVPAHPVSGGGAGQPRVVVVAARRVAAAEQQSVWLGRAHLGSHVTM